MIRYMKFLNSYRYCYRIAILAFVLMAGVCHAGNHYIAFNDGHLCVFPDSCIQSLTTTDINVSITDINGKVYTYPLDDISAISEEAPYELPTITSFLFDNKYNYQVVTDAVGTIAEGEIIAQVLGIGKWLTATFELSDSQARALVEGKEQQSKVSRISFKEDKEYTVGYPGDLILAKNDAGELALVPFGNIYTVHADFLTDHSTTVPRIDINTVGGEPITSKEFYLDAEIIIDGGGIFPSMTDSVKIKGRGHTSWSSNPDSKNPYRLKFASKTKPLGLTKGKNWVLIPNKLAGSMFTNAFGMKAASLIGTAAANHIIPVDLYINGVYKGNYNFSEKVGLAGNSVEVDDETVATLLKLDSNYDEVNTQKFRSTPYRIPCNIKDPDFEEGDTQLTLDIIRERFNAMCQAVQDSVNIPDYVDIDHVARYLMLNEFVCNYEIFHPKSGYCYNENVLDEESKFIFGPVWDFDWAYGHQTDGGYYSGEYSVDYFNYYNWGQSAFFKRLHNHPMVMRRILELWEEFMPDGIDELCDFCKEYYEYARPSLELNEELVGDYVNYGRQYLAAAYWLWNRATHLLEKYRNEVEPLPDILPGDANGDGLVNIEDVVMIINYVLSGKADGIVPENADIDGDGNITINDVTMTITRVLRGS